MLRSVRKLTQLGLLLPAAEARRRRSRLAAWRENLASAFYHVAARDQRYIESPAEADVFLRAEVLPERRPPRFKRYSAAPRQRLPPPNPATTDGIPLDDVLAARRTVRTFSKKAVSLGDLAALIRGTWGLTGWLQAGLLGRLATKTSPSAGALHPIECYVLAWNVSGLPAGLYHYDVAATSFGGSPRGTSAPLRFEPLRGNVGWAAPLSFA